MLLKVHQQKLPNLKGKQEDEKDEREYPKPGTVKPGEENKKGIDITVGEIITENFSELMTATKPIQEAQRTPSVINTKKPTHRHTIVSL